LVPVPPGDDGQVDREDEYADDERGRGQAKRGPQPDARSVVTADRDALGLPQQQRAAAAKVATAG